ncbi:MAG TPA: DUF4097 family beta strand repeat-containing protein [Acidobacteriota bacterium]|nr:DUF4097 family beta strand repeat-containing protein [Acidobacteriota bacterium]
MRQLFVLALIAGLMVLPAVAQEKNYSETLPFASGQRLSVDTYKGTIHISSWERQEIEVIASVEAPSDVDADYARDIVDATEVRIRQTSSGVSVKSDYDDVPSRRSGWLWGGSKTLPYVHYQIRVPRSLDLKVDDYKSDIEVYGVEGRIDLETYKGRIESRDLAGDLRIDTYKGRVDLDAVRGGIDIETYKGTVMAQVDSLDADSRLETYKGNITLVLPSEQGLELDADLSKRADLRSDFALTQRTRYSSRGDVRGSINGGGPRLRISSYKGDISLRQR